MIGTFQFSELEALIAVYAVGLYGINYIQCYWLLDNLLDKEDDQPSLCDGEGAMSCLFEQCGPYRRFLVVWEWPCRIKQEVA